MTSYPIIPLSCLHVSRQMGKHLNLSLYSIFACHQQIGMLVRIPLEAPFWEPPLLHLLYGISFGSRTMKRQVNYIGKQKSDTGDQAKAEG